jgi:dienelactone hydrolase
MPAHELPDLFRFDDGTRVQSRSDWARRRAEIAGALVPIEYGELPPHRPATTRFELKRSSVDRFGGAELRQYLISMAAVPRIAFLLDLLIPTSSGPFPAIVSGDACWPLNDEVPREVLKRGVILAHFNREQIVPDKSEPEEEPALRHAFPGDYGALAAWAWGHQRVIDLLLTLPEVNPGQIAVTGHSRGGKTALLAGAMDERIALVHANQSGCGGAGCFRWQAEKSETLADILRQYPHWFAPGLKDFIGREEALPFDQHSLKALVAPRPLLTTESLDDPWANPEGTWQSHRAAREAYRFLGAEENIDIQFRHGPHDHALADWVALLDFMEVHFRGKAPVPPAEANPFLDLPPAQHWQAPA